MLYTSLLHLHDNDVVGCCQVIQLMSTGGVTLTLIASQFARY